MFEFNNDAYNQDSPVLGRRAYKNFNSNDDDTDQYPTRDYNSNRGSYGQYLSPKRENTRSTSSTQESGVGSLSRLKTEEDLSMGGSKDFYHSDPRDYPTGLTRSTGQNYNKSDSLPTDSNGYSQNGYQSYPHRHGNMTYLTDDDFPTRDHEGAVQRDVDTLHPQSPTYSRDSYNFNNQSSQSSNEIPDGNQSTLSSRDPLERLDPNGLSQAIYSNRNSQETRTPSRYSSVGHNGLSVRNNLNRSAYSARDSTNLSRTLLLPNAQNLTYRGPADANHSILSREADIQTPRTNLEANQLSSPATLRTPTHKQNGVAKPVRDTNLTQSRQSGLNLSRRSLNLSRVTLYGSRDYGVKNSLVTLGLVSILSLILGILGLQLLFQLKESKSGDLPNAVLENSSFQSTLEVTVALSSLVIMLNLCCLTICSLQAYFAAKLQKCPQGDERAFKYLKECAGTRFIAITGFFISVPVLLLAVLLFMLMEFRTTPAIISAAVFSLGVIFVIAAVIHSIFFWRQEKTKADQCIPPYPGKGPPDQTVMSMSELSTLV